MIPEDFLSALHKTMDSTFSDAHSHRIDSSNYIEYRAPHPNKAKYTPPSPTTSGYSESGSEMDNHDSGRVSELEGSPKMQHRRPDTIPLTIGIQSPFSEGKSTIKMGRSASADSATHSEDSNFVTISAHTLKTLVVCLHDARTRLNRMESKMDGLVKVLELQHRQSNDAASKLSRTVLALGKDFEMYKNGRGLENGRRRSPTFRNSRYEPAREVPMSCNNNNLTSSATHSRKIQSSECLISTRSPPDLPPKVSAYSDYQVSTFPRFLRTEGEASHLSVAPSADKEPLECYDNCNSDPAENKRPESEYVNDEVIRASLTGIDDVIQTEKKVQRSPVYAVLNKKRKSNEIVDDATDQRPALPRKSCEIITSLSVDDVTTGDGLSDRGLDQFLADIGGAKEERFMPPRDDTFSNGESLTRVSRFSEVESLMSAFDSSTIFSEDKPIFDEGDEEFSSLILEEYDNTPADGHHDFSFTNRDVFSSQPFRNKDSGHMTHGLSPEIRETSTAASWHSSHHEMAYSNAPTVQRTVHVSPKDDTRHSHQSLSTGSQRFAIGAAQSVTSIQSEKVKGKGDKKAKKKASSTKDLSSGGSKKENVLASINNKLFKRKGRKKRSESQNSFYFVTSPLYESQIAERKGREGSPRNIKRVQSENSVLSDNRLAASSVSIISSSHEGSVSLGTSQGDLTSPGELRKRSSSRSLASIQSPSNTQLLRLQSKESIFCSSGASSAGDFDNVDSEEKYDNFEDDEMRPNLIKIAKKAFRNSPKLLRRGKTSPSIQTAELKPKLPNGHAFIEGPTPPLTPDLRLTGDETPTKTPKSRAADDGFEDDVFIPPGVILEKLQREQADRIRFDSDHSGTLDQPPPKPNRPGFSHGGVGGSPRSSFNAHPNGGVPGYPRGPAVPPKQKIMTPEELTKHEAHEKLRMKQMEEAMLQQTLDQQQKQAADNARWLEQEEQMLSPAELSANGDESALRRGRGSSNSLADMRGNMEAPPPPSVAPSKPPRKQSRPKDEPTGPPQTKLEEVKTAPTMQLNRDDDAVYKNTMEVVKSVLGMNNMTMDAKPDELFARVKTVGAALKQLCASLEKVMPDLPEDFHREIDMAQRTTNKDLSQVINQLKLVQRFYTTTQVVDYKKCLMAANQVLAIDAKNLLDVVDRARIRKIQTAQEKAKVQPNDIRQGAAAQPIATGYEPEDLYPDGEFL